jgi:hypothetical protein
MPRISVRRRPPNGLTWHRRLADAVNREDEVMEWWSGGQLRGAQAPRLSILTPSPKSHLNQAIQKFEEKVRGREGAFASRRGACALRNDLGMRRLAGMRRLLLSPFVRLHEYKVKGD